MIVGERMSVREKERRVTRRERKSERRNRGEPARARCKKEGIHPSAREIKGRDKRGEENASEIKGTARRRSAREGGAVGCVGGGARRRGKTEIKKKAPGEMKGGGQSRRGTASGRRPPHHGCFSAASYDS